MSKIVKYYDLDMTDLLFHIIHFEMPTLFLLCVLFKDEYACIVIGVECRTRVLYVDECRLVTIQGLLFLIKGNLIEIPINTDD